MNCSSQPQGVVITDSRPTTGGGDKEITTRTTAAAPLPLSPPTKNIVISKPISGGTANNKQQQQPQLPPVDTLHRAVHKIRLGALSHNFAQVESAANRQRCSVFVVVKADGYGHGAITTALYLADNCGADAFAVATLEEGIALRRAFQSTPPGKIQNTNATTMQPKIKPATGSNSVPVAPPSGGASTATTATTTTTTTSTTSALPHVASLFPPTSDDAVSRSSTGSSICVSTTSNVTNPTPPLPPAHNPNGTTKRRSLRPTQIRIMVMGPPVGFPRCFDDYYHHNIECMISGPEVARSLLEWVVNTDERKRTSVERQAQELKELVLNEHDRPRLPGLVKKPPAVIQNQNSNISSAENSSTSSNSNSNNNNGAAVDQAPATTCHPQSATLGNVTGSDLAKEVREILKNQKFVEQQLKQQQVPTTNTTTTAATPSLSPVPSVIELDGDGGDGVQQVLTATAAVGGTTSATGSTTSVTNDKKLDPPAAAPKLKLFGGIEEAAKMSRTRQKAITNEVFMESGDDNDDDENPDSHNVDNTTTKGNAADKMNGHHHQHHRRDNTPPHSNLLPKGAGEKASASKSPSVPPSNNKHNLPPRKRLRWHALVDSGMGRLGFRTDPVSHVDIGKRRDSVEIIKELVDLEHTSISTASQFRDCPIEFFGMMTHMADANPTSDYTQSQINRFKNLLQRVRNAGISVPTISTDNSAALLTTSLTHFDPKQLLTQDNVDTRGYVRTGGAIYGQRPSFKELRPVSTLMASVRHVAILKKGESVGYDRAYIAPMNVRIATLTIGFADGYPRELGNGIGKVCIRGHLFPVAGNVCMDMLMVELGPVGKQQQPQHQQIENNMESEKKDDDYNNVDDKYEDNDPGASVVVGDSAVLWGPDDDDIDGEGMVKLQDIAKILKTTQSALTCGLDKERVRREYA